MTREKSALTRTVSAGERRVALSRREAVADPEVDRSFPFDEIPAAVAYQETGHATGKVVVTV